MKLKTLLKASVLCAAISATAAFADEETSSTTTTSTTSNGGTVSTFTPDTFVVSDGSTPMSYSYSKTTTYVDENGNPVSVERVHSGVPVTVYYSRDGERNVATKVVVRSAAVAPAPAPTQVITPAPAQSSTTTTTTTRKSDD